MNEDMATMLLAAPGTILRVQTASEGDLTTTTSERAVVAFERIYDDDLREYALVPWVVHGTTVTRWAWHDSVDDADLIVAGTVVAPDVVTKYSLNNDDEWIPIEDEKPEEAATAS